MTNGRRAIRRSGLLRLAGLLGLVVLVGFAFWKWGPLGETVQELSLSLRYEDIIRQQAEEKDVPAELIAAVIFEESKFRDQTSSAGARGLMQITPDTADTIETLSGGETFVFEDLADPDLNIRYGTFYLRHLLDRFEGNEVAALAAYNAGPEQAEEWGGADLDGSEITFPETSDYVEDVLEKRDAYGSSYADELGL